MSWFLDAVLIASIGHAIHNVYNVYCARKATSSQFFTVTMFYLFVLLFGFLSDALIPIVAMIMFYPSFLLVCSSTLISVLEEFERLK